MVSSWFSRSPHPATSKEVIKLLGPPTRLANKSTTARFSQLLLEHGEIQLQDWEVMAHSKATLNNLNTNEETNPATQQHIRAGDDHEIQWAQRHSQQQKQQQLRSKKAAAVASLLATTCVDLDKYPSVNMTKVKGRLHLCSRSIVFEPTDATRALLRCPWTQMDQAPINASATASVRLYCKQHIVMGANAGPFETVKLPTTFAFDFLHSCPTTFLTIASQLHDSSGIGACNRLTSTANTTNTTTHEQQLKLLLKDHLFHADNNFVIDIREQPVLVRNLSCNILSPLQSTPGMIAVTADRVYFQPNLAAATKWQQTSVRATARRYSGLADCALELYFADETSVLFAFERRHDREQVIRCLSRNATCFTDRSFVVQAHKDWQAGIISNYEYLLALNSAAGRSFHDLSRYPVFPWVIADYESDKLDLTKESTFRDLTKPVGALNIERLDYFRRRMEGMQDMDDAWLYGTHYSAPGYVLYYLVRSLPEQMLCLQNGKFDAPDRMFHSMKQCYGCVLTNHADVKELIPEFYSTDFDFLINARGLQLGVTQNGDRVDDVQLPPWARSARDFLKKNRKALESEICTRMLPRWVDLVFGIKSRGEPAKEAFNLFHPMAYLGPTELAGMHTEEERFQAELQATEFGIVPDKLFSGPHPLRHDAYNDDFISADLGRASSKEDTAKEAWELLDAPSHLDSQEVPAPIFSDDQFGALENHESSTLSKQLGVSGSTSSTWSADGQSSSQTIKMPLRGTGESVLNTPRQPTVLSRAPLLVPGNGNPVSPTSPSVTSFSDAVEHSDWDMKIIERKHIHSDAVSGCVLLLNPSNQSILATTSLDGGLRVHKVTLQNATAEQDDRKGFPATFSRFSYSTIMSRGPAGQASAQTKLADFRSHSSRDPLASLVLASDGGDGHAAFAGGHDDVVIAYGINSGCAVASVYSHRDAVTGLDLIQRTPFNPDSAIWLEKSTHIMVSGSWDATVKVWSTCVSQGEAVAIDREPLDTLFDADSSIVCVSANAVPTGGIVIAAGCADGSWCVWNIHNDGEKVVIHNEPARRGSGACSVIKWASVGGSLHLFVAFSAGMVTSYSLTDGTLKRDNAVSVGVAVLSLAYTQEGNLLLGCADGALRLIPVRDRAYFDSKPTLWPAVNNKSSPGISSISVAYVDGTKNCICCTGAEDGSVALFEINKISKGMP
jgi:factor associated with neutral sphingomyelinase activation